MKWRTIGLAMLAMLAGACTPSSSSSPAMRGVDEVVRTHVIRAAYINYPPSMAIDPNTKARSGIMIDAMDAIAAAMEVKVDYTEETTFATMVDTLNSGRVDLIVSGIWPSSTRALKADFSRVVYYSPIYAYVRADDGRFDGRLAAANAPTVRVATLDGELSSIIARSDYPAAKAVSLPQQTDIAQLLLQLSANKADLTFVEPAVADAFIAKNPGVIRRVAGVASVRLFPNTFLFRKGDTGLRDAVDVAIVELTNAGRIAGMLKRYDASGDHFIVPTPPVTP